MGNRVKSGVLYTLFCFSVVLLFQNCSEPLPNKDNNLSQSSIGDVVCPTGSIEYQGGCVQTQKNCSVANGVGLSNLILPPSQYGPCFATTCFGGFQVNNTTNLCEPVPPPCPEGQQLNGSNQCIQISCPDPINQHIENNLCVANVHSCEIENGQGQKVWTGSAYSTCNAISCNGSPTEPNGFHIEGAFCKANKQSCEIPGGSGFQYWNDTSKTYSSCTDLTCAGNYKTFPTSCLGPLKALQRYHYAPNVWTFYWTTTNTGIPANFTLQGHSFDVFESAAPSRKALRSCYINGTYRVTTTEMGNVNGAIACTASAPILGYIESNYSEETPRAIYHCSYYGGDNSKYKMTAVGITECYGHKYNLLGYVP